MIDLLRLYTNPVFQRAAVALALFCVVVITALCGVTTQ